MSCVDIGAVMFELACKDASISTFFLLHSCLSNFALGQLAEDNLLKKIFDETLTLKKIFGWAITEPGNGSKVHTTARKVEGGYLLNGLKK